MNFSEKLSLVMGFSNMDISSLAREMEPIDSRGTSAVPLIIKNPLRAC
jgi:hypothetical protein